MWQLNYWGQKLKSLDPIRFQIINIYIYIYVIVIVFKWTRTYARGYTLVVFNCQAKIFVVNLSSNLGFLFDDKKPSNWLNWNPLSQFDEKKKKNVFEWKTLSTLILSSYFSLQPKIWKVTFFSRKQQRMVFRLYKASKYSKMKSPKSNP